MLKLCRAGMVICLAMGISGCVSLFPSHKGFTGPSGAAQGSSSGSSIGSSSGVTYGLVMVRSDTASQFYYAKSAAVAAAGPTEEARRAEMASRVSFGPFNMPTELWLMEYMAYDFFPRCGDAIAWKDLVRAVITPATPVKLVCR